MFRQVLEIFFIFLKLGLTSFGGPIAHLGYFHDEFVNRRKWFDENSYADLVALCQFLPGPASSQVGIAIGLSRAGVIGGIAAWLGFTVPSAILMISFAIGVVQFSLNTTHGWIHGLKIVAVAVVAQAIYVMGRKLSLGFKRGAITVIGAAAAIYDPTTIGQISVIGMGAIAGWIFLKDSEPLSAVPMKSGLSRRVGAVCLISFFALMMILPSLVGKSENQSVRLFDSFYRVGSLVFGGGHVVLPLLKAEVVNPGWVSDDAFLAGYGAAQALPGPLFVFSAYLGAVSKVPPFGVAGAVICLLAIFLPSFLLIFGALPFWEKIRQFNGMRAALQGINAAVVGLLIAAFYDPVWTSSILSKKDFSLAVFAFLLLVIWRRPSWQVVLLGAVIGNFLL